ncbi:MAG: Nif3-like dinuclear metal center hexameric protein [Salinivirgaceae bacterium]|jgi:dinuclear metal center YbgI/SA1388 family protein|nr:Nif3-like dinuclear metal center hexameric protein [Bacteroidales bacterium]
MKLNLNEIIFFLNQRFPLQYQESWDNSGLLVDTYKPISKIITCLDCTLDVVNEAIAENANLIVSHHPLIFSGIKKIINTDKTASILKLLIKNDIALYCAHTNLDNAVGGLNDYLAKALNLTDIEVLQPLKSHLFKIVTFVPHEHADKVRTALFNSMAGNIGNYDSCSFNIQGNGTFRGNDNTNPFVGKIGKIHFEPETRIETVVERRSLQKAINDMISAHPYEEVAYDIYPIENELPSVGLGRIGVLPQQMSENQLIKYLKEKLSLENVLCSRINNRAISKIAIIGGSGSSVIDTALLLGADAVITGDIKYHTYIDYESKLFLVDIGHFGSEKIAMNVFYDCLTKKFPNFAVLKSKTNLNPINYL